jgi:putative aldouronate transport system substrate-binding protein
MKKTKQVMSAVLAAAMAAGLMTGCGGAASSQSAAGSTTENATGTTASTEVPTFKIATVRWTDTWPTDFLESGVMKQLEEEAGVNIEWQIYYNSDWAEQKSLLLASGDLPDAFLGSICLTAADLSQNKANFVELSDLIDQNMPNLKNVFAQDPELEARAKDRNGEIYSLVKKLPMRPECCGSSLYINQDWLDKLGLKAPTNTQEIEDTLEAFVTKDPNGNGIADEIGYTGAASKTALSGDLRNILFPFGTMVSREDNYMGLNSEGTPVFMPAQENYKQAVEWMHDMYSKGLIDPEYFTQESSAATAKRQAEGGSQVGMLSGWTADAEAGTNAGQFSLLEAPAGPDGNRYVENASSFLDISDRELVVTKSCSDPAKLLKWADLFYNDEVSLQTFYGSIPDYVKKNDDGTYEVLTPSDGSSLDTSAWSNSLRDFGPKYMNPDLYSKITIPADQGDGIKLAEDAVNAKYVTTDKNVGMPVVPYTDEELSTITARGTDIYSYVEAQYAHWVVDGGIDDEWDSYLAQLKNMGLDDLVKCHTDAYAAYQAELSK